MKKNISLISIIIAVLQFASPSQTWAFDVRESFDASIIESDVRQLFFEAGLKSSELLIQWDTAEQNTVQFICHKQLILKVNAKPHEKVSAIYYSLRKLGFLFPHPRKKIIPKAVDVKKHCGQTFTWKPTLKYRGFHLHTQHPSEWVDGFFMDNRQIAKDIVWWLARNQQNTLQIQTLRIDDGKLQENLNPIVVLCHKLGINFGMSFGLAMLQQKNYYLIPFWRALTGIGDEKALEARVQDVIEKFNFDYVTSELGFTEFNSTDPERTLKFLQIFEEKLSKKNKGYFVKSHVSMNQFSKKYGNFNFLPHYSNPRVGVLAHTVFFYGLNDSYTPMYGRKNFQDMLAFMKTQNGKRPLWYFPETSYYIGMDIDVPLLLTDYLSSRADDIKLLVENNIEGQVNFTTGQELGYWLFDWNLALLTDSDLNQDPLAGLKLLGEDPIVWQKILAWQTEHLKKQQLIQVVSSSNLMDEFSPILDKTHERYLFRELIGNQNILHEQIIKLKKAIETKPDLSKVKNSELSLLLEILGLRFEHALYLREALVSKADSELKRSLIEQKLEAAANVRKKALEKMQIIKKDYNRYGESFVFKLQENATSYPYGYGWTALTLHFWEREEAAIKNEQLWNPFFKNIYDPRRILF